MPRSWRQMWLTVPMWTGPNSQQEEQVDVFAEHPVVRRFAADSLALRAVVTAVLGRPVLRVVAVMASVAVAAVVVATVVVTTVAVAKVLLLSATVSVVVKVGVMQTASTASSRPVRR